jgi:hypothetical protein
MHYETDDSLSLGHRVFIDCVLKWFHRDAAHGAATPLDDEVKLDLAEEAEDGEIAPKLYQAIIRSLMNIALSTRLDISFAVAVLSRYISSPLPQTLNRSTISPSISQRHKRQPP